MFEEIYYIKAKSLIILEDTIRLYIILYNLNRIIFIKRDYRTSELNNIIITL